LKGTLHEMEDRSVHASISFGYKAVCLCAIQCGNDVALPLIGKRSLAKLAKLQ